MTGGRLLQPFQVIALVSGLTWALLPSSAACAEKIRLSKQEVALLKRIDQIQIGAGIITSMLKAAPFLQLASSTSLVDMTITVGTSDWDLIYGALKGLNTSAACKTVESIDLWKDVDDNDYSSTESELFFQRIRTKANSRCQ